MPRFWERRKPETATPEELRELFSVRLDALDAATSAASLEGPMPVMWRRGWKAYLTQHGRDADGSLLASVEVLDPTGLVAYRRRVRLVKSASLKLRSR